MEEARTDRYKTLEMLFIFIDTITKIFQKSKLLDFQNGLQNLDYISSSTKNCIDISESVFNFKHCLIEVFKPFCEHNMHVNIEKKIRVSQ